MAARTTSSGYGSPTPHAWLRSRRSCSSADSSGGIVFAIEASVERWRGEAFMRVHVISDIEGVAGVVKPEQGQGGEDLFAEARRLYTEEINAAVRGARSAGATEIVVIDCHGAGKGCDVSLLVGMHARAGTADGVLSHTVSGSEWHNLSFNGTLVGETGINAALCGTWDCPVVLVTGDTATCREARELLGPNLVTVPVKQGLGRFSA